MLKRSAVYIFIMLIILSLTACTAPDTQTPAPVLPFVQSGVTQWYYRDDGIDPAQGNDRFAWTQPGYDYSSWKRASGSFGAQNGELSELEGGYLPDVLLSQYIDSDNRNTPAFFFATTFNITDISSIEALAGKIIFDDAVIVYINGVQVFSQNTPEMPYESNLSYGALDAKTAPRDVQFIISDVSMLTDGDNVLCVQLHQADKSSRDIYFDFVSLTIDNSPDNLDVHTLSHYVTSDGTGRVIRYYSPERMNIVLNVSEQNTQYVQYNMWRDRIESSQIYSYSVELTGLIENTSYRYWLSDSNDPESVILEREFHTGTPQKADFSFLFAGDPQIRKNEWEINLRRFNDSLNYGAGISTPAFIISAGDQVNDTDEYVDEYNAFLSAELFKSVPLAVNRGNHDSSEAYREYFPMPDANREDAYYFTYGDVLFIALNSNRTDTEEQKRFFTETVEAHRKKWLIVTMHHSLFGVSEHHEDSETVDLLRSEYPEFFSDADVDIVLAGHDHSYSRTYLMQAMTPVHNSQPGELYTQAEKKEGQTLYLSANSSSGSKFYDISGDKKDYIAVADQQDEPNITVVHVSENQIVLETYNTTDGTMTDSFTLIKKSHRGKSSDRSIIRHCGYGSLARRFDPQSCVFGDTLKIYGYKYSESMVVVK